MYTGNIKITELFGLSPWRKGLREAALTFRGDQATPPSRFDLTSLRILQPRMSFPLWLGRPASGRRVPIYNFFCRTQPPPELGWSVRVTVARDYRGLQATYDSHNGTDFAVPPGTTVVAAAPGRVLRVSSELHRGGLKVFIDHGGSRITSYNHLARALVRSGDVVRRGQPIALSGMSGIDGLLAFPFSTPHVHFNVWHDGVHTDPFAAEGEVSRGVSATTPRPRAAQATTPGTSPLPGTRGRGAGLSVCIHAGARADIESGEDLPAGHERALSHDLFPDPVPREAAAVPRELRASRSSICPSRAPISTASSSPARSGPASDREAGRSAPRGRGARAPPRQSWSHSRGPSLGVWHRLICFASMCRERRIRSLQPLDLPLARRRAALGLADGAVEDVGCLVVLHLRRDERRAAARVADGRECRCSRETRPLWARTCRRGRGRPWRRQACSPSDPRARGRGNSPRGFCSPCSLVAPHFLVGSHMYGTSAWGRSVSGGPRCA
ncbi:MAG: peptidoglycan DD-metalloendopeptidase family protein [Planctomycetes bacterium]|nr:peptidoglycan DD-metalloendopeptidase family protein [Planctomycetota bacterium]